MAALELLLLTDVEEHCAAARADAKQTETSRLLGGPALPDGEGSRGESSPLRLAPRGEKIVHAKHTEPLVPTRLVCEFGRLLRGERLGPPSCELLVNLFPITEAFELVVCHRLSVASWAEYD